MSLLQQVDEVRYRILKGAVPNMNVEGMFYVNDALKVGIAHARWWF